MLATSGKHGQPRACPGERACAEEAVVAASGDAFPDVKGSDARPVQTVTVSTTPRCPQALRPQGEPWKPVRTIPDKSVGSAGGTGSGVRGCPSAHWTASPILCFAAPRFPGHAGVARAVAAAPWSLDRHPPPRARGPRPPVGGCRRARRAVGRAVGLEHRRCGPSSHPRCRRCVCLVGGARGGCRTDRHERWGGPAPTAATPIRRRRLGQRHGAEPHLDVLPRRVERGGQHRARASVDGGRLAALPRAHGQDRASLGTKTPSPSV